MEIDVDIASSYVAQKILGVVRGYAKKLTMDLAVVIQGNSEEELPERVLGVVRFHQPAMGTGETRLPRLDTDGLRLWDPEEEGGGGGAVRAGGCAGGREAERAVPLH
jgi:hypothetical protein